MPKKIAVIGAGPAGLSAAITAAQRGHAVTLFESAAEIGGQLNMAKIIPGKEEFRGLVGWFRAQLDLTSVTTRLNHKAMPSDLDNFDEIIIATGVVPRDPGIKTNGSNNVLNYIDVLRGKAHVGAKVAIIGAGGIGFDVAEYLSQNGESSTENPETWRQEWGISAPWDHRAGLNPDGATPELSPRLITMLQRKASKPGAGLGKTTGWIHRETLRKRGVKIIGGITYEQIGPNGLQISRNGDEPVWLEVDQVILCAGQVSERGLADQLIALGRNVHIIGGADQALELDAKRAIDQGTRLAASL